LALRREGAERAGIVLRFVRRQQSLKTRRYFQDFNIGLSGQTRFLGGLEIHERFLGVQTLDKATVEVCIRKKI